MLIIISLICCIVSVVNYSIVASCSTGAVGTRFKEAIEEGRGKCKCELVTRKTNHIIPWLQQFPYHLVLISDHGWCTLNSFNYLICVVSFSIWLLHYLPCSRLFCIAVILLFLMLPIWIATVEKK